MSTLPAAGLRNYMGNVMAGNAAEEHRRRLAMSVQRLIAPQPQPAPASPPSSPGIGGGAPPRGGPPRQGSGTPLLDAARARARQRSGSRRSFGGGSALGFPRHQFNREDAQLDQFGKVGSGYQPLTEEQRQERKRTKIEEQNSKVQEARESLRVMMAQKQQQEEAKQTAIKDMLARQQGARDAERQRYNDRRLGIMERESAARNAPRAQTPRERDLEIAMRKDAITGIEDRNPPPPQSGIAKLYHAIMPDFLHAPGKPMSAVDQVKLKQLQDQIQELTLGQPVTP